MFLNWRDTEGDLLSSHHAKVESETMYGPCLVLNIDH